jgi:hypothetical protein
MGNDIERQERAARLNGIAEYYRANPPAVTSDQGQHIHVHHHYAPAPAPSGPVDQNPGQSMLDRYTPYFVLMLGGTVILAIVGVIVVLIVPMIVTMLFAVAGCLGALAVLALAVSGSLGHLNKQRMDQTTLKKAIKK